MLPHDDIKYRGTYSVIGTNDEAGEGATLRMATVRNGEWWSIGGVGSADDNGFIQSTVPNTELGDVALANSKNGQNRLGKGDLIAAFDALTACAGDPVSFTNNSTALNGNIITYGWDFGDTSTTNDTSSVANPNYTYRTSGDYTVMFFIASDSGDRDTVYKTLSVYGKPDVGFAEFNELFPSGLPIYGHKQCASTKWY